MSQEVHANPTKLQVTEAEAEPPAVISGRKGAKTKAKTKSEMVIALLTRSRGVTIDEMMTATGWQAHSVRGFIAGNVKKKLAHSVASETTSKGRVYHIVAEAG